MYIGTIGMYLQTFIYVLFINYISVLIGTVPVIGLYEVKVGKLQPIAPQINIFLDK